MTFQVWKRKCLNSVTFQVFQDLYDLIREQLKLALIPKDKRQHKGKILNQIIQQYTPAPPLSFSKTGGHVVKLSSKSGNFQSV